MVQRYLVETVYRGRTCKGEWYVEDGLLHVTSTYGYKTGPVATGERFISLPSEIAKQMLWELVKSRDPKPPFFTWR